MTYLTDGIAMICLDEEDYNLNNEEGEVERTRDICNPGLTKHGFHS